MRIQIELPEEIAARLRQTWGDVSRRTLEAVAAKGYRDGALSAGQVRRLLGLESRLDVEALLKREGASLDYSGEDLEADLAALRALRR